MFWSLDRRSLKHSQVEISLLLLCSQHSLSSTPIDNKSPWISRNISTFLLMFVGICVMILLWQFRLRANRCAIYSVFYMHYCYLVWPIRWKLNDALGKEIWKFDWIKPYHTTKRWSGDILLEMELGSLNLLKELTYLEFPNWKCASTALYSHFRLSLSIILSWIDMESHLQNSVVSVIRTCKRIKRLVPFLFLSGQSSFTFQTARYIALRWGGTL